MQIPLPCTTERSGVGSATHEVCYQSNVSSIYREEKQFLVSTNTDSSPSPLETSDRDPAK
jgi:hypothetical protein